MTASSCNRVGYTESVSIGCRVWAELDDSAQRGGREMNWKITVRDGEDVIFTDDIFEYEFAKRLSFFQKVCNSRRTPISVEISQGFLWNLTPESSQDTKSESRNIPPIVEACDLGDGG